MKKYDDRQLMFDFDAPTQNVETEASEPVLPVLNSYLTFPKEAEGKNVFETLAVALGEIHDYQLLCPKNLNTFVFEHYFVMGATIKEIEMLKNQNPDIKIPSRERIRQIAFAMASSLYAGDRCRMLGGVRLSNRLCEKIQEFKKSECGVFVDDGFLPDNHQKKIQGIALLLGMNIVEGRTVLPIMKNRFFLSDTVPVETFWQHFRILLQLMQEDVRPQSLDKFQSDCNNLLNGTFEPKLIELILTDDSIFEKQVDASGRCAYMLRFEHLKIYQQLARIIFEKKSISIQDINAEMLLRGVDPKAMSLSQTRRKYPWCVPMGKTLWIYKEDEQAMDRIQDVIKDYCMEHVRFRYEEILDYLHTLHYDMKESSLRNYIMQHCRRLNADRNVFCLTSAVPVEEESLWYKKAEKTTRERDVAYRQELTQMMTDLIQGSSQERMLRKELRKMVAPFLEQQGVSVNNFYKILNASEEFEVIDNDGETYVIIQ